MGSVALPLGAQINDNRRLTVLPNLSPINTQPSCRIRGIEMTDVRWTIYLYWHHIPPPEVLCGSAAPEGPLESN